MEKEIKDLKSNRKKLCLILAIILIIIIIIVTIILMNSKKEKNLNLSDFEKVGVYNYLENDFLDYDLLEILADEPENEIIEENHKMGVAIEFYFKKYNTNKVTKQELKDTYYNIFGEELRADIEAIDAYTDKYLYNFEKDIIEKNPNQSEENEQKNYKLKISDIYTNNDEYNVKLDLIRLNNDISLENDDNMQEEKIGTATLTLKVKDGRYNIVSYNESID